MTFGYCQTGVTHLTQLEFCTQMSSSRLCQYCSVTFCCLDLRREHLTFCITLCYVLSFSAWIYLRFLYLSLTLKSLAKIWLRIFKWNPNYVYLWNAFPCILWGLSITTLCLSLNSAFLRISFLTILVKSVNQSSPLSEHFKLVLLF